MEGLYFTTTKHNIIRLGLGLIERISIGFRIKLGLGIGINEYYRRFVSL